MIAGVVVDLFSTQDFIESKNINFNQLEHFYLIKIFYSVLMDFVVQFNSKADILMDKLSKLADENKQIDLFDEMNHATLDAIALVNI